MTIEVRVPTLGESIIEATISKWLKQEGETVVAGEPLLELETDKVNLEVPAEHGGVVVSRLKAEGETVHIGDVLCIIAEATAAPQKQERSKPEIAQPKPPAVHQEQPHPMQKPEVFATPVAQRVAEEHEVNIRDVHGSGDSGRVTKGDVLGHIQQSAPQQEPLAPKVSLSVETQAPEVRSPLSQAPLSIPTTPSERREERQRMSRRRQTIAQRLLEAQHSAAMLTTFNEIDMSSVMAIRQRHKERFKERHGIGLGFMSFFVKATIGALKAFPLLNAEIQGDDIVTKYYYDIGIAVGTEQGLVVPVLRDADQKSFAQIEQAIAELAARARENRLTLVELQGGTFSITNGGIYGSLMSTPILNMPQVGILGMHKIEERPVVVKGAIEIRPMMYVALSYDHRIVDGSDAVRFLVRIKELIEYPETMLLEG